MIAPAWFTPLTPDERSQLQALVLKATGVEIVPPSTETPLAWLTELCAISSRHFRRAASQAATMSNEARAAFVYDPKSIADHGGPQ